MMDKYARQQNIAAQNATIEDFSEVRELGSGNFGKVTLVKYKNDAKKLYALKEVNVNIDYHCYWELYERELKLMHASDSRFVVKLYYYFWNRPKCIAHLVMQYYPAGDFSSLLSFTGPFDSNEKALKFYAANMVLAIQFLHTRNVIHRDVKPENFLGGEDRYLAIADFGLGVLLKEGHTEIAIAGTNEYMAPEIHNGSEYTQTVDWWSLGVTLVEIATGKCMFDGDSEEAIKENILHKDIVFPKEMSSPLKIFLNGLLTRDPNLRLGAEGAKQVREHEFFKGVDWQKLHNHKREAPYLPKFDKEGKLMHYWDTNKGEPVYI
ncbi:protein kinase domain-containing protein [Ditylenchus destructor]|uniref:Protein kinase domain-containing protein n=1 Tax=Ditylenchus destructor TaxID=166010 RepID=A0AAD4MLY1_9BILA|nr:protein kinase domain-containing protein [Ditylenchus destructor]